jgi:hypothetical protein
VLARVSLLLVGVQTELGDRVSGGHCNVAPNPINVPADRRIGDCFLETLSGQLETVDPKE